MSTWEIYLLNPTKIKVEGRTLEQAVRAYGKKHPRKIIEAGLLVRVKEKGIFSYWAGQRFLEVLG